MDALRPEIMAIIGEADDVPVISALPLSRDAREQMVDALARPTAAALALLRQAGVKAFLLGGRIGARLWLHPAVLDSACVAAGPISPTR